MSKQFQWLYIIGPIHGGPSDIPVWNFSEHTDTNAHPEGVHDVLPGLWVKIYGYGDYVDPLPTILGWCIPAGVIIIALIVLIVLLYLKKPKYTKV